MDLTFLESAWKVQIHSFSAKIKLCLPFPHLYPFPPLSLSCMSSTSFSSLDKWRPRQDFFTFTQYMHALCWSWSQSRNSTSQLIPQTWQLSISIHCNMLLLTREIAVVGDERWRRDEGKDKYEIESKSNRVVNVIYETNSTSPDFPIDTMKNYPIDALENVFTFATVSPSLFQLGYGSSLCNVITDRQDNSP